MKQEIFFLQIKCETKEQRISARRMLRELKDRSGKNYIEVILSALKRELKEAK